MEAATRRAVERRAGSSCEYCRLPSGQTLFPFQIDHIIYLKHGGDDELGNLAWSCFECNVFKGPNIAGVDPQTGRVAELFHPRRDEWKSHFEWDGPELRGLTSAARATVAVLRINLPVRVERRRLLILAGSWSPT